MLHVVSWMVIKASVIGPFVPNDTILENAFILMA